MTTARQPLVRIGLEATRLVLLPQRPEGDRELRLNTELVLRDSCGCTRRPAPSPRNAESVRQSFNISFLGQRERVLAQLSRAARGLVIGAGANWAEQLLYALVDDLGSLSYDRFVPLVERIIAQLRAANVDLTCIDDIISVLRDELVPLLRGEMDKYKHAEDLFQAVRLATSAAIQRSQGRAHLELTRWARTIAVVCNAIASASGFAELQARIREYLPQIGMHGCFVVVYTTPGDSSYGQVVASYDTSERREDLVGKPFRPQRLLPEGVDLYSGERCFAVLPLLGQRVVIGHVLFEYTPRHAFACKVLADAISIVVHAAPKLEGEAGGPPSVVFPSERR